MKISVKAFAITTAILWAGCILLVGICNLVWPTYGMAFLQIPGSIYPGYNPGNGAGSVVIGTLYAILDGFIGGAIFGLIYNIFAKDRQQ